MKVIVYLEADDHYLEESPYFIREDLRREISCCSVYYNKMDVRIVDEIDIREG